MLRLVFALLLVAAGPGCNRPSWDTPVRAYETFARALEKGEVEDAYGTLSTSTRDALARRAKEISQLSGGAVKDDPAALFFTGAPRSGTKVELVKEEGDRAVVAVRVGAGPAQQVRMVREAEGWRIDLDVFEGSEASGATDAAQPGGGDAADAGRSDAGP